MLSVITSIFFSMKIFVVALALFLGAQEAQNYKILAILPLNSRSHFVMFERLLKGLAEKGHEVDVVSHFPQKKPIPR